MLLAGGERWDDDELDREEDREDDRDAPCQHNFTLERWAWVQNAPPKVILGQFLIRKKLIELQPREKGLVSWINFCQF